MAASALRLTACLLVSAALAVPLLEPAAGQRVASGAVEPRCFNPFRAQRPSCFCTANVNNDWFVSCGCKDVAADQEVVLTPGLLPPESQPIDGLIIHVRGCRSNVTFSAALVETTFSRFSRTTLEVVDSGAVRFEPRPAAEFSLTGALTATFIGVRLPRIDAGFFSNRLSVRAVFERAEIGTIAGGAFAQPVATPAVTLQRCRVDRIAAGAFELLVGVKEEAAAATADAGGLVINQTEVGAWESDAYVGGARLAVVDSRVGRLHARAVSTTGLVRLHWNGTVLDELDQRAIYQHAPLRAGLAAPLELGFHGNSFVSVRSDNASSAGPLHFAHGVPAALRFLNNDVSISFVAPVTPVARPGQLGGTRLHCDCGMLAGWLAGSGFGEVASCRPRRPGDRLQTAAEFVRDQCGGAGGEPEPANGGQPEPEPANGGGGEPEPADGGAGGEGRSAPVSPPPEGDAGDAAAPSGAPAPSPSTALFNLSVLLMCGSRPLAA